MRSRSAENTSVASSPTRPPSGQASASRLSERLDGSAGSQTGKGEGARSEHPIAANVCFCCKTSVATGPNGTTFVAFRHIYPTNLRADYAQYKLGMVHFRQMRGPQRDQTQTREAIKDVEQQIGMKPTGRPGGKVLRAL